MPERKPTTRAERIEYLNDAIHRERSNPIISYGTHDKSECFQELRVQGFRCELLYLTQGRGQYPLPCVSRDRRMVEIQRLLENTTNPQLALGAAFFAPVNNLDTEMIGDLTCELNYLKNKDNPYPVEVDDRHIMHFVTDALDVPRVAIARVVDTIQQTLKIG